MPQVLEIPKTEQSIPVQVIVPGVSYRVLASDGRHYYPVTREEGELHCKCLHEVNGRRNGKPCRHIQEIRAMAMIEESSQKSEPKFLPVIDAPVDDDPFAGHPDEKQAPVEKPTPSKVVVGRWEMPALYDPFYRAEERSRSLAGSLSS